MSPLLLSLFVILHTHYLAAAKGHAQCFITVYFLVENKSQLTARLYCKLYTNIFSDPGTVAWLPQERLRDWDPFLQANVVPRVR